MQGHRTIHTYKRKHIHTHINCVDRLLTFLTKYNIEYGIYITKYNIIRYTLQYNAKYNVKQDIIHNIQYNIQYNTIYITIQYKIQCNTIQNVQCCTMLRIRGSGSFWNVFFEKSIIQMQK